GERGRMRDWSGAGCYGPNERLLGVGDIDPQMSGCRTPLGLRVEQHDHSVAELDLDGADAAVGIQHPRARCLLGVEGSPKERNLGLGVRADHPRVYPRVTRRNRHYLRSTGLAATLAWPSDTSQTGAFPTRSPRGSALRVSAVSPQRQFACEGGVVDCRWGAN